MKKNDKREPRMFKAEFEALRNDLYWTVCFFDYNNGESEWFKFEWVGYDDDYWWNKVSPTKTRQTRTGDKGHKITLEIDFRKCMATEILED